MDWLSIDSSRLLGTYGTQIFAEPLVNNRFIGLLGLVRARPDPAKAWALKDSAGCTRLLAAQTAEELVPLVHPMFPLTPDVVQAIRQRFPSPFLLTLHDHQCEQWEQAVQVLRLTLQINLRSNLYVLPRGSLRLPASAAAGHGRPIPSCDAIVRQMIIDFAWETLGKTMQVEQAERAFERNNFYGWYEGGCLLAMAAATRSSVKSRCLSFVFTRPDVRGRGLAEHLLAAWCPLLFADYEHIFLYADAQNASSNRLYQKLGFRLSNRSLTYA